VDVVMLGSVPVRTNVPVMGALPAVCRPVGVTQSNVTVEARAAPVKVSNRAAATDKLRVT
jgi:hypothetical protein